MERTKRLFFTCNEFKGMSLLRKFVIFEGCKLLCWDETPVSRCSSLPMEGDGGGGSDTSGSVSYGEVGEEAGSCGGVEETSEHGEVLNRLQATCETFLVGAG